MTPVAQGQGILNNIPVNQRSMAALSTPLPPAPNRTIGLGEKMIRVGGAGLAGAQQGGLQAMSDMATMYGGIQDYNRSRALEDYNAKVNGMYRSALAQKAAGATGNSSAAEDGSASATQNASTNVVFDAATRAFDILNNDIQDTSFWNDLFTGGTGWSSVIGKYLPTHKANALNGLLTTIKGNLGFDKLQAMRDASPTGGALGQVSEMELRQLNAAFGDFEQSKTPEELKYNLEFALHTYFNIVHGEGNHDIPRPLPRGMEAKQEQDNLEDIVNRNTKQE